MPLRLTVKNLAVLRDVSWEIPEGVSAVVGPNGSGKTTLLATLEFLNQALRSGLPAAADEIFAGAHGVLNRHAPRSARIELGLQVESAAWSLEATLEGASLSPLPEERLVVDGNLVLERQAGSIDFTLNGQTRPLPRQLGLKIVADLEPVPGTEALLAALSGFRLYRTYEYNFRTLQRGSLMTSHRWLHVTGTNVFTVLRNWRDQRATLPRYEFVRDALREIFAGYFRDFEVETAGQTITFQVLTTRWEEPLPIAKESTGFFVALLTLCAVASADRGGIVAIDEPENALHPLGIRRLLGCIRDWASRNGLRVLLATHSPVLLNQFRDEPTRLFVMEPGESKLPVRADELLDPHWIQQFGLGDMYGNLDYGAPPRDEAG
ncbi:MAG TPA: AAA family ATPase [Candidatus Nanopelagicales bacterium]|nr:AAA family ATPase [Candidatus Nanopelagicales bacterium]